MSAQQSSSHCTRATRVALCRAHARLDMSGTTGDVAVATIDSHQVSRTCSRSTQTSKCFSVQSTTHCPRWVCILLATCVHLDHARDTRHEALTDIDCAAAPGGIHLPRSWRRRRPRVPNRHPPRRELQAPASVDERRLRMSSLSHSLARSLSFANSSSSTSWRCSSSIAESSAKQSTKQSINQSHEQVPWCC